MNTILFPMESLHLGHLYGSELNPLPQLGLFANRCLVSGDLSPHDHDFFEIVLIASGYGDHTSIRGRQKLGPGDTFILRPGTWHGYENCQRLIVFNCGFSAELLNCEFIGFMRNPALHYMLCAGPLSQERQGITSMQLTLSALQSAIVQIKTMNKLLNQLNTTDVELLGHLLALLGSLLPHQEMEGAFAQTKPTMHQAVQMGTGLLESQPQHEWTLEELAKKLHLNASYLSRLFKASTGLAPMQYLARCRAELAARQLIRTNMPIHIIAQQTGWDDPNYFAQRFKAHFGLTAGEYRRRFQRGQAVE